VRSISSSDRGERGGLGIGGQHTGVVVGDGSVANANRPSGDWWCGSSDCGNGAGVVANLESLRAWVGLRYCALLLGGCGAVVVGIGRCNVDVGVDVDVDVGVGAGALGSESGGGGGGGMPSRHANSSIAISCNGSGGGALYTLSHPVSLPLLPSSLQPSSSLLSSSDTSPRLILLNARVLYSSRLLCVMRSGTSRCEAATIGSVHVVAMATGVGGAGICGAGSSGVGARCRGVTSSSIMTDACTDTSNHYQYQYTTTNEQSRVQDACAQRCCRLL
jgi:hypothetical protein